MNIIQARQEARKIKIRIIQESLRKSKNPDIKKLVIKCCLEWGCSKRYVMELIELAKHGL